MKVYEKYKSDNRKKLSSILLPKILPITSLNNVSSTKISIDKANVIDLNSDSLESTLQNMETLLNTECSASWNKFFIYTEEKFNALLKKKLMHCMKNLLKLHEKNRIN